MSQPGFTYRPTKAAGKRTRFYWACYTNADGKRVRHVLTSTTGQKITDRKVADSALGELLRRVEREVNGLTADPYVTAAGVSYRRAVADFLRWIRRNKRHSRNHLAQVRHNLRYPTAHRRRHANGLPASVAPITRMAEFNAANIDRVLGAVADAGKSPRTINAYRRDFHSFAEWAVSIGRLLETNPVAKIKLRDESADTRKARRAITIEQARKLLEVSGPRRTFYLVQLLAGLRVNEVAALEWRDVLLDGPRPVIRLRAATTKSKRADEVPLHPDLVEELGAIRPAMMTSDRVRIFKSTPTLRSLKGYWRQRADGTRVRQPGDLERAGIDFADEDGRTVDRHAFRTAFVSWLGASGVDPRAQIKLARHAPQGVTMRHYQDFGLFDLHAEIAKLPSIRPVAADQQQRATGTCERLPVSAGLVVPKVVPRGGKSCPKAAVNGTTCKSGPLAESVVFPEKNSVFEPETDWAMTGSNRRPPACKAGALAN